MANLYARTAVVTVDIASSAVSATITTVDIAAAAIFVVFFNKNGENLCLYVRQYWNKVTYEYRRRPNMYEYGNQIKHSYLQE